jgi:glycosyltransferase involved in cell wall biosynthesis
VEGLMKLSIVVPTHNRLQTLSKLLQSLIWQDFDWTQGEVLVVSNFEDPLFQSTEFTQLKASLPLTLLSVGRENVNAARNLGLEKAKGEVLWYLDDDCELSSRAMISELLNWHHRKKDTLAIGGSYQLSLAAQAADKAYFCISQQWQADSHWGIESSSRLVGGNTSYKRKWLLQTGQKFNEEINFGGSEAEFNYRLLDQNLPILFIPEFQVIHNTSLTEEDLTFKAVAQARGQLLFEIDPGYTDSLRGSYHSLQSLMALDVAKDQHEFDEINRMMQLFDKAYHQALVVSSPRFRQRSEEGQAHP